LYTLVLSSVAEPYARVHSGHVSEKTVYNTYIVPQVTNFSCSSAFVSQTEWAYSLHAAQS